MRAPLGFGPPRTTFAVSDVVLRVSSRKSPPPALTPTTLLSSGCSSPRSSNRSLATFACARVRASPGVSSPSALDNRGRPYTPVDPTPPAPSVLGVSHALDGLLRPRPCQPFPILRREPFVPTALLGFHLDLAGSYQVLRLGQGLRARASSSRLSPIPRRARVRALSSPALRPAFRSLPFGRERCFVTDGRFRVSIAGPSAFSTSATRGRRPS